MAALCKLTVAALPPLHAGVVHRQARSLGGALNGRDVYNHEQLLHSIPVFPKHLFEQSRL